MIQGTFEGNRCQDASPCSGKSTLSFFLRSLVSLGCRGWLGGRGRLLLRRPLRCQTFDQCTLHDLHLSALSWLGTLHSAQCQVIFRCGRKGMYSCGFQVWCHFKVASALEIRLLHLLPGELFRKVLSTVRALHLLLRAERCQDGSSSATTKKPENELDHDAKGERGCYHVPAPSALGNELG